VPLRVALAAATIGLASAAIPASAASHEYCYWDGTFSPNSANTKCFQSGENWLTDNYAYEPYGASGVIYCGANLNGSPYVSATSATDGDCRHAYGGGNLLKAWEYVSVSAWTHGVITY
jgi:hypothetical protein